MACSILAPSDFPLTCGIPDGSRRLDLQRWGLAGKFLQDSDLCVSLSARAAISSGLAVVSSAVSCAAISALARGAGSAPNAVESARPPPNIVTVWLQSRFPAQSRRVFEAGPSTHARCCDSTHKTRGCVCHRITPVPGGDTAVPWSVVNVRWFAKSRMTLRLACRASCDRPVCCVKSRSATRPKRRRSLLCACVDVAGPWHCAAVQQRGNSS